MPRRRSKDLVHRWEGNPLLTIDDLSFRCNIIRNAGGGPERLLVAMTPAAFGQARYVREWLTVLAELGVNGGAIR